MWPILKDHLETLLKVSRDVVWVKTWCPAKPNAWKWTFVILFYQATKTA